MKISKRQLNKIIKEEIVSTIEEMLTEKELDTLGEVPFEGAGMIDVQSTKNVIKNLELEMEKINQDFSIPDEIKKDKLDSIMDRIRELEHMDLD
mgnify:CR=1 FL=1|tara:strand:+ start:870 stop:1151 length:282 start_codon:yes stop_codon:yes gene_type:complete